MRWWPFARLLPFFLRTLIDANLRMALIVLQPRQLRPAIVAVPLALTGRGQIALLANWISLTPGTLTLDVVAEVGPGGPRYTLYVHGSVVYDPDALQAEIKGYERHIQAVWQ
jgi:multicomponent Na+:H+ antiporter subunit E